MKIKVKITLAGNMKYYNCPKDTIKEIELEDYVRCVVASEMGNAPLEACKAQAIASRTFAVSRGVLEGKVISDAAAKAQAFIASRTNYENCNKAAEETAGQILTYGGKTATTYFSHSNGGRTYSCEEVWGQKRPYLIARKDDWTKAAGSKKNGHGIGMSQEGAKYAGSHGIGYRDILSFYYPYTTMKQIEIKQEPTYEEKVLDEVKVRVELALKQLEEML